LLIADPQHDPEVDHRGHHLRQHLNHARRTGVIVREYLGETTPDARLEAQAEAACEQWLTARHRLQLYLGRPRLFGGQAGAALVHCRTGRRRCRHAINATHELLRVP
jgi:hypothetical protein